MEDEAHVGLVDAHAEGDGGADDHPLLGHEQVLVVLARRRRQAGMIGNGAMALRRQKACPLLRTLARQAIDDTALALVAFEEGEQLLGCAALGLDGEPDIGAVEAGDMDLRLAAEQLGRDVAAGRLVGGGGEGADGDGGKGLAQILQRLVFGPEGCPPFRYAMGLVDDDQLGIEFAGPRSCARSSAARATDRGAAARRWPPSAKRQHCRRAIAMN